jgi:hypothetical protein
MAKRNDGPGIDAAQQRSNKSRDRANDGLDSVRQAKRRASERTTADVSQGVLDKAKRERWTNTTV